ncbi:MAG: TlyA family RNA methyltransferase [Deltaproteobacteria bacterium]|nr:MAG: TlyA family RNA methyltransferase [Deltaproteobacteria bacterium]
MSRVRLDKLLVSRGLAPSRDRAQALIAAGAVEVDGVVARKAASQVARSAAVRVRDAPPPRYVSRGGLKLERGLDAFGIDPAGAVALDVGASTGGFTDVLLQRGAARVYALDVGYGQLAWSLRTDPRVVVIERKNIRYATREHIPEECDLAVIDTSFISLRLVLPPVAALIGPDKPIVALVKPQFEVGRDKVGKGGVVRDPADRLAAVDGIRAWARQHGFAAGDAVESPIAGPAGNVEYLLLLRSPAS